MKVTYRPETLAIAFDLANRVAPHAKGGAWDTAAGMIMDVHPDGSTKVIATSLEVAMNMTVGATEVKDAPDEVTRWRMSSLFLAPFVKKLTAPVIVQQDAKKNVLVFKSGQSKLAMPLMNNDGYPELHQPPGGKPVTAANLANFAERVLWACDTNAKSSPLAGLHADGTNLVGCRHEGLALMPSTVELADPITFQGREMLGLLKGFGDIGISADNLKVFFWLNETDWVSASLIQAAYPKYEMLRRDDYASSVEIDRGALIDCLERMSIVASMDRADMSKVMLTITDSRLHLKMNVKDVGDSEEYLPISCELEEPFTTGFSLGFLLDAVKSSQGDSFTMSFGSVKNPANGSLMSCRIVDATGWESLIMPRRS